MSENPVRAETAVEAPWALRCRFLVWVQALTSIVLLWEGLVLAAPMVWEWRLANPWLDRPSPYILAGVGVVWLVARRGTQAMLRAELAAALGLALAGFAVGAGWLGVVDHAQLLLEVLAVALIAAGVALVGQQRPAIGLLVAAGAWVPLALLWIDNLYYRFGKGHLSLMHFWLFSFDPGRFFEAIQVPTALVVELVLLAAGYVVLTLAMMFALRGDPAPVGPRAFLRVAALWLVLLPVAFVRLPALAWPGQFAGYLNLRLSLLVPVPSIPPFTASGVREVAQSTRPVDLACAHAPASFSWRAGSGRPPHIVVIWAESLRADLFETLMPRTLARARSHTWLRRHHAQANGTITSLIGCHYGIVPIDYRRLLQRGGPPPWHSFLAARGYRFVRCEAEEDPIRISTTAHFTFKTHPQGQDGYLSSKLALDDIRNELRTAPGPMFVEGYLFNTHFNYYYPPAFERFKPTIDVGYSIFLLEPSPPLVAGLANRYRNSMLYLDEILGEFFAGVEADGRLADTVFVVLGDHGESLGENNYLAHCTGPVPEQFRVPGIVIAPGDSPQVVETPTEHLDVIPTLAPWVGYTVTGLPGIDALSASKTAVVSRDDSAVDRLLVRGSARMSIFTLSGDHLRWLITTTPDYALDARPDGLYGPRNTRRLAAMIGEDLETAWQRLRQQGPAVASP